ncbi:hypothetical protein [Tropicibacter naphthalenivorans]|uniref:Uncharacterized protein n=1 Tax=Tropicibacter naphthalenivorans TaxID=441103 RepID=A0A0P1G3L3_9RHOB|nr:hypothetical protein [Tropicibacter naphthalenivorans]CUH76290.1 hypothetical protein TRN7648_00878 [Tropicibacter naphthalenivorans]SMC38906.1 hypothetical protein SAMN04488093_1014 [Tropicibacter naphthalenivorans]
MEFAKQKLKTEASIHGRYTSRPLWLKNGRPTDGWDQFYIFASTFEQAPQLVQQMNRGDFDRLFKMTPVLITCGDEKHIAFKVSSRRKYKARQVEGRLHDGKVIGLTEEEMALVDRGEGGTEPGLIWFKEFFQFGPVYISAKAAAARQRAFEADLALLEGHDVDLDPEASIALKRMGVLDVFQYSDTEFDLSD